VTIRFATADTVKHLIASAILGSRDDTPSLRLGSVTLRPHQSDVADRLCAMIDRAGGAMLAEPVGLGKTFTGLAVATRLGAQRIVVVIPAALHPMWLGALEATGVRASLLTHEALSRGVASLPSADLVIVDESHRFRNPHTNRYAAVAALSARTRVLLLSATPIQNARDDLAAQLALFLGRRAFTLPDDALASHVVRGARDATPAMPRVAGPFVLTLDVDDDCVDRLLGPPPPIPARDEETAAALLTYEIGRASCRERV